MTKPTAELAHAFGRIPERLRSLADSIDRDIEAYASEERDGPRLARQITDDVLWLIPNLHLPDLIRDAFKQS